MKWNNEVVRSLADEYEFEVVEIQPYHLRLTHPSGKKLDYFPKSGRATWLSSQEWFTITDIEEYINQNFKK